jgi:exodeoxyribonuclease VII small subunit
MDAQVPQALGLAGIAPPSTASGRRERRVGAVAPAAGRAEEEPPAEAGPAIPFEAGLSELERIVRDLEAGELGLEESLRLYERGVALVRACAAQLDAAEARVKVLTLDEEGRPTLQPLPTEG